MSATGAPGVASLESSGAWTPAGGGDGASSSADLAAAGGADATRAAGEGADLVLDPTVVATHSYLGGKRCAVANPCLQLGGVTQ